MKPTKLEWEGLWMLKRQYGIFQYPDGDIRLSIKFLDENYQTLGDFFIIEVHNFYSHIYKELEAVVTGQKEASDFGGNMLNIDIGKEETEVYYQMDDESLGDPCFIPTEELYKLVIEWKEMEDKMYSGADIFPVTIKDWIWTDLHWKNLTIFSSHDDSNS